MQAIFTKYLPPTNHRDARIKAFCDAGSVTVGFHDGQDAENWESPFQRAAMELIRKLGWTDPHYGEPLMGGAPQKSPYACVFVFPPKASL